MRDEKKNRPDELTDDQLDQVHGGININQNHLVVDGTTFAQVDEAVPAVQPTLGIDPLAVNINNNH